jgi:hypothetical protein
MNNILKKKGKLKGNNIREHIIMDREISRPGLKKIFWAEDHL